MASETLPRFNFENIPDWEWLPEASQCDDLKQFSGLPFHLLPFGQFSKRDNIHMISNWYSEKFNQQKLSIVKEAFGDTGGDGGAAGGEVWDKNFRLVYDDSVVQKTTRTGWREGQRRRRMAQQKKQERMVANRTKISRQYGDNTKAKRTKRGRLWKRSRNRNWNWNWYTKPINPSVMRCNHWKELIVINMEDLENIKMRELAKATTLVECGHLPEVEPRFDRERKPIHLRKHTDKTPIDITTSKDPILMQLKDQGKGNVFATDTILALLMTCWRSVYSWDIIVDYYDGIIVFDKRRKSMISHVTVDENINQQNQPKYEEQPEKNKLASLTNEATNIQMKYRDQVLSETRPGIKLKRENPFVAMNPDKKLQKGGYLYRQWLHNESMNVVCRCEVHACKGSKENSIQIRALNQYCHRTAKAQDWRKDLATKGQQVALNEYSRNKSKVARWIASAVLAACPSIKIGWIVRQNVSNTAHDILKTETHATRSFAGNNGVSPQNMWAVLGKIVTEIRKQEEGRYIIIKDPNHKKIRLYQISPDDFENEGDEEDVSDDDDDDEKDD